MCIDVVYIVANRVTRDDRSFQDPCFYKDNPVGFHTNRDDETYRTYNSVRAQIDIGNVSRNNEEAAVYW